MIFQDVGIYMYDIKDYLSKKIITRWSILEGKGGGRASVKSSRTTGQNWDSFSDKDHNAFINCGYLCTANDIETKPKERKVLPSFTCLYAVSNIHVLTLSRRWRREKQIIPKNVKHSFA